MTQDLKTVRVRVGGRVQGVGFRAWTRGDAERRGLAGYVRNEADGSVSAVITGPADAVSGLIDCLWQGPLGPAVSVFETPPQDTAVTPNRPPLFSCGGPN